MKISVIVPVYNCEAYLPVCIDSILQQTFSDLEIIVIDDGSTDGSPAICDTYAKKDTRIRVIHQSNQGVSVARNTGLAYAKGDAITFVDSDDTIDADMYEVLSALMLTNHADVSVCGYRKVYFDGSHKEILGTNEKLEMSGLEASRHMLVGSLFTGSPCTKLYRRILFEDIRFDPELKINEDILMNVQIFNKSNKVVFWDVCKYNYFERAQSATRITDSLKIKHDCVKAAEKMLHMSEGKPIEGVCLGRLRYALIDLYRTGLLRTPTSTKQERNEIHRQYLDVSKKVLFDLRTSANYCFMRYLPWIYVKTYQLYQKLHKQDNDI